jgi:hypothetical protein
MPVLPPTKSWQHCLDDIDRSEEVGLELLAHHRQRALRSRQLFNGADGGYTHPIRLGIMVDLKAGTIFRTFARAAKQDIHLPKHLHRLRHGSLALSH